MTQPPSSPWLAELQVERPHFRLEKDTQVETVIVGAGIAGVTTAYNVLRMTKGKVLLLDAGRIAHGATGRNAGQVVSYFERPLADIAQKFGVEMAIQGQLAVEGAWSQLEDIVSTCNLRTPLYSCKGYSGLSNAVQIVEQLEEKHLRAQVGLSDDPLLLAANPALLHDIPPHLLPYILQVPHSTVLRVLGTEQNAYIAAEASQKGCMNSALFCEELVGWMTSAFPDRFSVAEHLPVSVVTLRTDDAELTTNGPKITASHVVLCTNGFENFEIRNEAGKDIDTSFHSSIRGCIGYMAGYIDEADQKATAISYHNQGNLHNPYYYLTRRPYKREDEMRSLVCIGGPERPLPDRASYDPSSSFPANIEEELETQFRSIYKDAPPEASRMFLWQGLMGYTPNNIRRVGFEPQNHRLLYNLGCNGVGILPSIYGGKRIAQLLAGMHLAPSIFDPDKGEL